MNTNIETTGQLYPLWKDGVHSDDSLMEELKLKGLDSLQIVETLTSFKKKKHTEKQNIGFVVTAIGAFIGFLSCLFTMLDFAPEMRGFMLYGLTSIAILVVFIGLFLIFE